MPKNSVNEWDSTAANNTDVGGISIAEGMAPANVNNAMREIMAQVKAAVSTWVNPTTTDSRTSSSTTAVLQAKAMNDHRTSGDHDGRYCQRNSNLSDLQSAATARGNLGLGSAATAVMGTGGAQIRTNDQNDARFAPISTTSVGVGQTWQNVLGSRAHSTSYQNTTGKPIMVSIGAFTNGDGRNFQVSTNGSSWVTIYELSSGGARMPVQFVVPDNHYYRISQSCIIDSWAELR